MKIVLPLICSLLHSCALTLTDIQRDIYRGQDEKFKRDSLLDYPPDQVVIVPPTSVPTETIE